MSEALPYIYKEDEVTPSKDHRKTITHVFMHNVPSVKPEAFQQCDRLVEVIFTEGLNHIYSYAFEKCSALESVSFPDTLQTIGKCAFRKCLNLSELELPEMLVEIDTKAFEGCQSLCAISFPESTTTTYTVWYQAFANCTSLLGIEFPNTNIKLGRNAFQGCHALVNVSIPMSMAKTGAERCFAACASLQKCYPACDFPEALMDRYYKLPLHNLCYHASSNKLTDLHIFMNTHDKYDTVDRWGMTAYHILATSAKLRPDWILALMSRYPLDVVLKKDRNDKTVLDYLILYKSHAAIIVFQKVLKRLLNDGMSWGMEEWRLDMGALAETYGRNDGRPFPPLHHTDDDEDETGESGSNTTSWDARIRLRHESMDGITSRLAGYGRKEVTSLLEQALWKKKIKSSTMSRVDCQWSCGSEFIIPHVADYLWHGSEPLDGLMYLNL